MCDENEREREREGGGEEIEKEEIIQHESEVDFNFLSFDYSV